VSVLIAEKGLATADEELRLAFLRNHLRSLAAAVAEGIPVAAYLYWSLMDNFESTSGTAPRFGLAATDFATQERTPRPAAAYFAEVCKANALPEEPARGVPLQPSSVRPGS
jgi:beta-glucosidase